jgi:RimJ/RimL family protein N-acetyltransferase
MGFSSAAGGLGIIETVDGAGIRLRRFRDDDAADLVAACNDPLTQRFIPLLPSPYGLVDARDWINRGAPNSFTKGGGAFAVVDPASDRILGAVGVNATTPGQGEIGYWIAPWARCRGVATAACTALTGAAFSAGISRLELHAQPENAASQRVAIASGYYREGLLRGGGIARDGRRYDLVSWARLSTDPPGPSPRLLPDLPDAAITDGVVTLRPLRTDDAAVTHALRVLPDVIATSVPPLAPSLADVERMCARAESDWLAGTHARLAIVDAASDRYAGEIGLYYSEPSTGQAMVGYSMLPAWRRKGFATRAVRLLSSWAFSIGVARVIAGTAPTNVGSQRVLMAAGFQQEGYQRSRLPGIDGERIDDVLFALLPR